VSDYRIDVQGGQYRLEFEHEGIVPLAMAPSALEEELGAGRWLVLVFAVWSSPDRAAIDLLVEHRDQLRSDLHVGVRPFDSHAELDGWCPTVDERHRSPLWLLLVDGQLEDSRTGAIEAGELLAWLGSEQC
jgi:hypothetical protein